MHKMESDHSQMTPASRPCTSTCTLCGRDGFIWCDKASAAVCEEKHKKDSALLAETQKQHLGVVFHGLNLLDVLATLIVEYAICKMSGPLFLSLNKQEDDCPWPRFENILKWEWQPSLLGHWVPVEDKEMGTPFVYPRRGRYRHLLLCPICRIEWIQSGDGPC